jgi:hypothetical protein
MLRLDDRLRVAISAGMGVQLTPQETVLVAGWLVALRQISERRATNGANQTASRALGADLK